VINIHILRVSIIPYERVSTVLKKSFASFNIYIIFLFEKAVPG